MTDTPKPQAGVWTLTGPDGQTWQADSPLRVVAMEQRERVPAQVALQQIMEAAFDGTQPSGETLAQRDEVCEAWHELPDELRKDPRIERLYHALGGPSMHQPDEFKPDWANYERGRADGRAGAAEAMGDAANLARLIGGALAEANVPAVVKDQVHQLRRLLRYAAHGVGEPK